MSIGTCEKYLRGQAPSGLCGHNTSCSCRLTLLSLGWTKRLCSACLALPSDPDPMHIA